MPNRIQAIAILAGVVLLAGTVPALAQPSEGRPGAGMHFGHPRHGGHGPGMLEHLFLRLDVSDEQRESIHGIFETYHEGELAEIRDSLFEARRALGDAIHNPAGDEQAVVDAAAALAGFERQGAVLRHRMFVEICGVLNEEQLEELGRILEQHAEFPKGPRSRFGHGRGRMPADR